MEKRITIEGLIHRIGYWTSIPINIITKLIVSTLLGMGSKDIVYSLNEPLGMGYALWASYALTALLFYLLPNVFNVTKQPLNLKIKMDSLKKSKTSA